MRELIQLNAELMELSEYVKQRIHDAKKDITSPEYLRMVSPPYECEVIAINRISKLIRKVYG